MSIIKTTCSTGPMKSRECLAFFGIEYQSYLWVLVISLLIGFGSYFIYARIRKIAFETKNFLIKSLLISLIIFIIFSILSIFGQRGELFTELFL